MTEIDTAGEPSVRALRPRRLRRVLLIGAVTGALIGTAVAGQAATAAPAAPKPKPTYSACVDGKGRLVAATAKRTCRPGTHRVLLGSVGATGPIGATGATGPAGAKGDPGAKGDAGAKGATGPKGDTGGKGDTGATGPQGPGAVSIRTTGTGTTGTTDPATGLRVEISCDQNGPGLSVKVFEPGSNTFPYTVSGSGYTTVGTATWFDYNGGGSNIAAPGAWGFVRNVTTTATDYSKVLISNSSATGTGMGRLLLTRTENKSVGFLTVPVPVTSTVDFVINATSLSTCAASAQITPAS